MFMFSNSCGDTCGWLAAVCSMLAFGTFGVPIKSDAARSVDIDPLVFQSYKTFMCFATSWLVLAAGEEFTFSPWGIVSGLFWVPGGVATIYAVKSAGLAIGIGIGSSFIVLVSFIWGVFIFDEHVHSRFNACFAIFSMMLGLFGMSYYSSPEAAAADHSSSEIEAAVAAAPEPQIIQQNNNGVYQGVARCSDEEDALPDDTNGLDGLMKEPQLTERTTTSTAALSHSGSSCGTGSDASDRLLDDDHHAQESPMATTDMSPSAAVASASDAIVMVDLWGFRVQKRKLGMLSAAFCGIWGGSIMAPMKFATTDTKGTHYLMSFSIGASIVTLTAWLLRYLFYANRHRSFSKAYDALPSFHLRVMWLAGCVSGLLWSIGNFFSLISVFYLGEGVGYSVVQTSILVSGLWGIFYFKEVQGRERVAKWFISSLLTIFGILLLSYEHHEK